MKAPFVAAIFLVSTGCAVPNACRRSIRIGLGNGRGVVVADSICSDPKCAGRLDQEIQGDATNFVSSTIQAADLPSGHVDALGDLAAGLCGIRMP